MSANVSKDRDVVRTVTDGPVTLALLEQIVERLPGMVFVKRASDLRFVLLNATAEQLIGIPRSDMLGKSDHDFFPAEQADAFVVADRVVLANGERVIIDEEPLQTPGGLRWLKTQKVPLYDADGSPAYLLGMSEDITELRDVRAKLDQQTAELKRSNRELLDFAHVASHDLNEPLRTIAGFRDLIEDELGEHDNETLKVYLDHLGGGVDRMQQLLGALLELSRVGTTPYEPVEVALTDLLARVEVALVAAIERTKAEIIYGDLPAIQTDPLLLTRVLQNLIENALKFRRDVPPRISFVARSTETDWIIEVQDNGIGFDMKYHDRIFQPFKRLHGMSTYPGTGMGLAICQRVLTDMGGDIRATSKRNEGTCFFLTLPKKPPVGRAVA